MAQIAFAGRLARDPDIRQAGDQKVAHLRVLESHRNQDQDGTWHDGEPTGHDVEVWGARAEHATMLKTGDSVVVIGRLSTDTWTDSSGQTHRRPTVRASELGLSLKFEIAATKQRYDTAPMGDYQALRQRQAAGEEHA